jgi:alpha-L-fucosidase
MNADVVWEENRGIGHSCGYNRNEQLGDYKSSHDLILMLVNVVARGGNLLLDIGPTADGRIPIIMQQRLIDIGDWLATNGEAIYTHVHTNNRINGAKARCRRKAIKVLWQAPNVAKLIQPKQNEAHIEYFFTKKDSDLYCIVPAYTPQMRIRDLKIATNTKASILGRNKSFTCKQSGSDCIIDLSQTKPGEIPAEMFVVKLSGVL